VTPERWRQACALFAAVRCAPAEREALLRQAGAGHPEVRTEVDRLLAGDARADGEGFLRVPDPPGSTQDQVCDRFEAAVTGACEPTADGFLGGAHGFSDVALRPALLFQVQSLHPPPLAPVMRDEP